MQTSARTRNPDPRSFAVRKGHLPQLSISDDAHHVTEAIGYMYGDEDLATSPHGPKSPYRSEIPTAVGADTSVRLVSQPRRPLTESQIVNGDLRKQRSEQSPRPMLQQTFSWENGNGGSFTSPVSAKERSPSDTATTQFPLNDIDYESSPAAVAQELSNLQALRRMSMDVAAAGDPDLPQLNTAAIPGAPSADSSEDDSSRLFWVPARLHPELAPKEFKSFLDSKAEQIKRRSGELSQFATPPSLSATSSLSSNDSTSNLRRKKSMLSRQINSSIGYQDGAERLERKKSRDMRYLPVDPNLEELESLVSNTGSGLPRTSLDAKIDEETGDIILPSVPGSSLKRSTRTKYQRSDSQKGRPDRATYAQRAARRAGGGSGLESPVTPSDSDVSALPNFSLDLDLSLKDPTSSNTSPGAPNFSRPVERGSSPPRIESPSPSTVTSDPVPPNSNVTSKPSSEGMPDSRHRRQPKPLSIQHEPDRIIPQIVESPPPDERPVRTSSMRPPPTTVYTIPSSAPPNRTEHPVDEPSKPSTSRPPMPSKQSSVSLSNSRPPSRSQTMPSQTMPPQSTPSQSLEQPSPLPGQDSNTSNLSYIPTLTVDKRADQKKKEDKKSGWSWLLGKEESERDKDKVKTKVPKSSQSHDNTRLDVLQTSIDGGGKGRESIVLDRESLKLEEERKKESQRKVSGGEKKEKESIFSSIFGGKKHKTDKEAHKKLHERLSPEPRPRELRPDIDFNWTRFSILEERAIYRMAHIKLANPRRALYSQVLLSNFMYSYLAKVQQMHPQMNLPTSAKQQRKQKEQQQHQQQQPDEFAQYQRYQQQQAQQASVHQQQDAPQPQTASQHGYDSGSSAYSYDNIGDRSQGLDQQQQKRPNSRGKNHPGDTAGDVGGHNQSGHGPGSYSIIGGGGNAYHHQTQPQVQPQRRQNNRQRDDDDDDDDMW